MRSKSILIVEDDMDILLGLGARLKANGYKPLSAADAVSAVSMARTENPDLVILDLGLPGGDGFVVMKRLRTMMPTATIPIIVLTAADPFLNRKRALEAGAYAFLQKPIDIKALILSIQRALAGKKALAGEKALAGPHEDLQWSPAFGSTDKLDG